MPYPRGYVFRGYDNFEERKGCPTPRKKAYRTFWDAEQGSRRGEAPYWCESYRHWHNKRGPEWYAGSRADPAPTVTQIWEDYRFGD